MLMNHSSPQCKAPCLLNGLASRLISERLGSISLCPRRYHSQLLTQNQPLHLNVPSSKSLAAKTVWVWPAHWRADGGGCANRVEVYGLESSPWSYHTPAPLPPAYLQISILRSGLQVSYTAQASTPQGPTPTQQHIPLQW